MKTQPLKEVSHIYTEELYAKDIVHDDITTIQLFTRIWYTYREIDDNQLGANLEQMTVPYHHPCVVEALFT